METLLAKSAGAKDSINRTKLIKYIKAHDVLYARISIEDFSDQHLLVIFKRLALDKRLDKLRKFMLEKYPHVHIFKK